MVLCYHCLFRFLYETYCKPFYLAATILHGPWIQDTFGTYYAASAATVYFLLKMGPKFMILLHLGKVTKLKASEIKGFYSICYDSIFCSTGHLVTVNLLNYVVCKTVSLAHTSELYTDLFYCFLYKLNILQSMIHRSQATFTYITIGCLPLDKSCIRNKEYYLVSTPRIKSGYVITL